MVSLRMFVAKCSKSFLDIYLPIYCKILGKYYTAILKFHLPSSPAYPFVFPKNWRYFANFKTNF